MLRHTMGPWTIDDSSNISGPGDRHVASAGGVRDGLSPDNGAAENRANAELIALAPSLLEAVRVFVVFMAWLHTEGPSDIFAYPVFDLANGMAKLISEEIVDKMPSAQ